MFEKLKCILVLFLFLMYSNLQAQEKVVDSLKRVLQNPKLHDTTRLYVIANILDQYYLKDGFHYWNDAMGKLAMKSLKKKNSPALHKKYTQYLGGYYNNLGSIYEERRNAVKASENYSKSIALFKSIKVYNEMSYAIIAKGIFLTSINDYEKAIACYFEALRYFEKIKNHDGISYSYASIGAAYSDLNEYEKAIAYFKKAIHLSEKYNDGIPEDDYVQSELHANCGSAYFLSKDYPKALSYFSTALSYAKKNDDFNTTSIILAKIARVKIEECKFDEAEKKLKEALKYSTNETTQANAYARYGEFYYKQKIFDKADFYLTQGLDLAIKARSSTLQEQISALLFKLSVELHNSEKALKMHLFLDQLKDSVNVDKSRNALERQQLKYNFEKKEYRYKLKTQKDNATKNNLLILLFSVIVLLAMGGWFLYRNSKQKQRIAVFEKNDLKQKLLLSQMNPHFIFNSIDNIKSLIYNKKDEQAVNYLTRFSKLTRQILENSNEGYISLQEEVVMLENYLIIQQLLYGNSFTFTIDLDANIDTEAMYVPPMLTQPFIENAIKHGLKNKPKNGIVAIRFYKKESQLFFEVSDNGSGFNQDEKKIKHKSLAVAMTKERLVNYTKKENFEWHIENIIDDQQRVVGARINFEIPYIYEN